MRSGGGELPPEEPEISSNSVGVIAGGLQNQAPSRQENTDSKVSGIRVPIVLTIWRYAKESLPGTSRVFKPYWLQRSKFSFYF